jgi:hypothetical protein
MSDTYENGAEAEADREQLLRPLDALDAAPRALRRDECGAWTIHGRLGRISTWGDGVTWAVAVETETARGWSAAKGRLAFCRVTQDGDSDGVLRLHALPTAEQAVELRHVLGIPKRRHVTEEERQRLAELGKAFRFERGRGCEEDNGPKKPDGEGGKG